MDLEDGIVGGDGLEGDVRVPTMGGEFGSIASNVFTTWPNGSQFNVYIGSVGNRHVLAAFTGNNGDMVAKFGGALCDGMNMK